MVKYKKHYSGVPPIFKVNTISMTSSGSPQQNPEYRNKKEMLI